MRALLAGVAFALCWSSAASVALADTSAAESADWSVSTRATILTNTKIALGHYFFADKVPKLQAAVTRNRITLESITDPNKFADSLTGVLYAVARDKHIFVEYSTEPVPQSAKPTATDIARMRQEATYDDYSYDVSARLHGNVGYLWIDGFDPLTWSRGMFDSAMTLLAHTDALIIDLRGNSGGQPAGVDYFLGYFFDKPTEVTGFLWRNGTQITAEHKFAAKTLGGPRYIHKPVYVLIDGQTISAGEQFAYDMKTLHRAELVGETTAGGANPGGMVPIGKHFAIFVPTGTARSPYTGTNWEGVGVSPDLDVPSKGALLLAYTRALKAATDSLGESAEVRARALRNPAQALEESLPNR